MGRIGPDAAEDGDHRVREDVDDRPDEDGAHDPDRDEREPLPARGRRLLRVAGRTHPHLPSTRALEGTRCRGAGHDRRLRLATDRKRYAYGDRVDVQFEVTDAELTTELTAVVRNRSTRPELTARPVSIFRRTTASRISSDLVSMVFMIRTDPKIRVQEQKQGFLPRLGRKIR